MRYEFFSETPGGQEAGEQTPLLRNLERGVDLEQHRQIREQAEWMQRQAEHAETAEVIGTPEKDMENWHVQSEQNSCAIACQEFVAEQLLNQDFSEKDMIRFASERGWYRPESGTPEGRVGDILEALGLEVQREKGQTLEGLAESLQRGRKIICGVNNMILSNPEFAEIPGLRANHAVEVIGIDATRPNDVQVILNDSGVADGQGRRVNADTFMKAWNTGRNFAVTAWKEN